MSLAGKPMVEWSIAACRGAASVRSIVIVCPPGHVHDFAGDVGVVDGGATRAESVRNALDSVDTELVAIHDAARPLISAELIENVVATLVGDPEAAGAIAAAPVADTIKQVASISPSTDTFAPHDGPNVPLAVESTLDRDRLWGAQTPQVFRVAALQVAVAAAADGISSATDEAMMVEAAGGRVLIHPSPAENLKVTTPFDRRLAELLLGERSAQ